ncbi:VOC family protein [Variovorax rhizosphaerae]|uniref:VOC family protein n=1 Tax=Variovorax rhizosphaerae TaxID=1836200 RepID=A0ABU8WMT8_9BURK
MQKITPCLWFDGQAEEALNFYAGIFKNSRVYNVKRYGDAGPGKKGSVLAANVSLDGQEFMALNGGPMYKFTPAISLFVSCETQNEVDHYWHRLLEGGKPSQCGWLDDKFGVSWQIVPKALGQMLEDKDPRKANAVMTAMLKMVKLDVAALKSAYDSV